MAHDDVQVWKGRCVVATSVDIHANKLVSCFKCRSPAGRARSFHDPCSACTALCQPKVGPERYTAATRRAPAARPFACVFRWHCKPIAAHRMLAGCCVVQGAGVGCRGEDTDRRKRVLTMPARGTALKNDHSPRLEQSRQARCDGTRSAKRRACCLFVPDAAVATVPPRRWPGRLGPKTTMSVVPSHRHRAVIISAAFFAALLLTPCGAVNFVTPSFAAGHSIDSTWPGTMSGVAAADMDKDGDVDVVASGMYVSWYESDGSPTAPSWTQHVLANVTGGNLGSCGAVAVGDLNQVRMWLCDGRVAESSAHVRCAFSTNTQFSLPFSLDEVIFVS